MNLTANRPVHDRHGIIGGSSLGNLIESLPYGCRRRLAYQFLGYPPTNEKVYTSAMKLGHRYEPQLRDWASDQLGVDIQESPFLVHPELPFLGGHPDGIYGVDGIIEIKTANSLSYNNIISKEIYASYKDQLTLYMAMTNRFIAHFVVGCSEDISKKVIIYFPWDQDRYDRIINSCIDFVCLIQKELPPRKGYKERGLVKACRRCEFKIQCMPAVLSLEECFNNIPGEPPD
jgi:CRISPR/Cas system-associated exonuclease Cas4 (RecB family)